MAARRTVTALLKAAASTALTVTVTVLASLAADAATSQTRWPNPLDWVRTHAWISVGCLGVAAFVLAFAAVRPAQTASTDPPPPPP